jgi:hypothetical protein
MIRTLSCHCGAIQLEVKAELGRVRACNCSICGKSGFLHWYVKPGDVRLKTPSRGLSTYVWREVEAGQHFCPTCGVTMTRTHPDNYFSVNARCLDGVDVFELEVENYDGLRLIPGDPVPPFEEA